MLTLKVSELQLQPGHLFLDAGAGFGRHAFEAARLGAKVVALDYASDEVVATRNTFAAMAEAGEISADQFIACLRGDAGLQGRGRLLAVLGRKLLWMGTG